MTLYSTEIAGIVAAVALAARISVPHIKAILRERNIHAVIKKVGKKQLSARTGKDIISALTRCEEADAARKTRSPGPDDASARSAITPGSPANGQRYGSRSRVQTTRTKSA